MGLDFVDRRFTRRPTRFPPPLRFLSSGFVGGSSSWRGGLARTRPVWPSDTTSYRLRSCSVWGANGRGNVLTKTL